MIVLVLAVGRPDASDLVHVACGAFASGFEPLSHVGSG